MWGRVDEVREPSKGSGEANGGTIEGDDKNLGVRVKGIGNVQVVGYEAGEEMTVHVSSWKSITAEGDVGTAGKC